VVAKQRAVDRGDAKGRGAIRSIGVEIRVARSRLGLSLARVSRECGLSLSELSRIERADAEWASVVTLARICAVVGLDLSVKAYPGGVPIRDARHNRQLTKLQAVLHSSLEWGVEVSLPNAGDQRAWDAVISTKRWLFGVECELNPLDRQALLRRLKLKEHDGGVDGVVLLLPDTRQSRIFRREFAETLRAEFPTSSAEAVRALASGERPASSVVIVL
jgi:transcriptional regulator with XRE-family HTH domain